MSGPQSWEEMRRGLKNRKEKLRRRNVQIKDLIYRLSAREKELAEAKATIAIAREGLEEVKEQHLPGCDCGVKAARTLSAMDADTTAIKSVELNGDDNIRNVIEK